MPSPATLAPVRRRLRAYARLVRLDRPVGIWLLLWPPMWSLWLAAGGWPPTDLLAIFVAGVVLMRSAGCAINDYADRDLDRHIARTQDRPLACGEIPPRDALWVTAVLLALAFGLALQLPRLTLMLAFPAALLAVTYPFAKRFHHMPQVHLGLAFAWSVPMAISALTEAWPHAWGWLAFAATVAWVVAYDTLYAMADRQEDLQVGNRSTAILLARMDVPAVALLHGAFLGGMALVGGQLGLGAAYYAGLAAAAALAAWQLHAARGRKPERCFQAFKNNAWVGGAIWTGIVLDAL